MSAPSRDVCPLMPGYFIVVDPNAQRESFVAAFGEEAIAVSFVASELAAGRELVVLDGTTGEQIYPADAARNDPPPRKSGLFFHIPADPASE